MRRLLQNKVAAEAAVAARRFASVHAWLTGATAFLASGVEAVEALTIVLAVGFSRSWRPALGGAGTALLLLAAVVALFGPLLGTRIPIELIRLVAGAVAFYLGVTWIRKAILRASGRKALHDESAIFERERSALSRENVGAFATSFNGVLVEGVEVVVIVISFGSAGGGALRAATAGALCAIAAVIVAGFVVRAPLARVPENAMKMTVAIMLLSFGTFWLGEAAGIAWPLADASLVAIALVYAALSALTVRVLGRAPAV